MAHVLVVDSQPTLSHQLSELVRRFNDQVAWVRRDADALDYLHRTSVDLLFLDDCLEEAAITRVIDGLGAPRPPIIVVSKPVGLERMIRWHQRGITGLAIKPVHDRELLSLSYALLRRQRRVVCLGGGTGLYTLLLGLKTVPNTHLTSIVSMSDDGGSAGRIREAFGILPPGDVRRSLVALSSAPSLMNELMQYRFPEGEGLKDHNLGNLLLTAMASLRGSMADAVRAMGDILNIQGIVLPVTTTLSTLVAELEDGTLIRGERHIDVPEGRHPSVRIAKLWQEPTAEANPNALAALLAADVITIGPGDLFTSILATLTVAGIPEAIRRTRASVVYICNLMTKPGETSGFTVEDHVGEIIRYLGEDVLDAVFVSTSPVSQEALTHYAQKGQSPVRLDEASHLKRLTRAEILERDLSSEIELVRHDSQKLANEIAGLLDRSSARPLPRPAARSCS